MKRRDAIDSINVRFGGLVEKLAVKACDEDEKKALMVMKAGLMTFTQRIVDGEITSLRRKIRKLHQEMAEARRDFDTMGRIQLRRGIAQMIYDAPFAIIPLSTPVDKWDSPETVVATKALLDQAGLFQTEYEDFTEKELDEEVA